MGGDVVAPANDIWMRMADNAQCRLYCTFVIQNSIYFECLILFRFHGFQWCTHSCVVGDVAIAYFYLVRLFCFVIRTFLLGGSWVKFFNTHKCEMVRNSFVPLSSFIIDNIICRFSDFIYLKFYTVYIYYW